MVPCSCPVPTWHLRFAGFVALLVSSISQLRPAYVEWMQLACTGIAVLVRCKDGTEFQVAGNAFQVKGAFANAAISAAPLSEGFCTCLREFLSAMSGLEQLGRVLTGA